MTHTTAHVLTITPVEGRPDVTHRVTCSQECNLGSSADASSLERAQARAELHEDAIALRRNR